MYDFSTFFLFLLYKLNYNGPVRQYISQPDLNHDLNPNIYHHTSYQHIISIALTCIQHNTTSDIIHIID